MSSVHDTASVHSKSSFAKAPLKLQNEKISKKDKVPEDQLSSLQSDKGSTVMDSKASVTGSTGSAMNSKGTSVRKELQFRKGSDLTSFSKGSVQLDVSRLKKSRVGLDVDSTRPSIATQHSSSTHTHHSQRRESRYRNPSQMENILAGSRRVSTYRRLSQWNSHRSTITSNPSIIEPVRRYAPSYRLPDDTVRFNSAKAVSVIDEILKSKLTGESYIDSQHACNLAKEISEDIKGQMHQEVMGWSKRYKYICVVTLVEWRDQWLYVTSQCLWSNDNDTTATAQYSNKTIKAVATVFAIYQE